MAPAARQKDLAELQAAILCTQARLSRRMCQAHVQSRHQLDKPLDFGPDPIRPGLSPRAGAVVGGRTREHRRFSASLRPETSLIAVLSRLAGQLVALVRAATEELALGECALVVKVARRRS